MSIIERSMLGALNRAENFHRDNTTVTQLAVMGGTAAEVRLHGNLIAKCFSTGDRPGVWSVDLCGWNTLTTRSRLSAILREFIPGCRGVTTRKGTAYVLWRDGNKDPLPESGMVEIGVERR